MNVSIDQQGKVHVALEQEDVRTFVGLALQIVVGAMQRAGTAAAAVRPGGQPPAALPPPASSRSGSGGSPLPPASKPAAPKRAPRAKLPPRHACVCLTCGKPFQAVMPTAKSCSDECRAAYARKQALALYHRTHAAKRATGSGSGGSPLPPSSPPPDRLARIRAADRRLQSQPDPGVFSVLAAAAEAGASQA